MPTIIRTKTFSQLNALATGSADNWNLNYAGGIIRVSDKGWDLLCLLNNKCIPLSGVLKITNGDTLPDWLTPQLIEVNFGTITTDISVNGIEIDLPVTYLPVLLIAKNLDEFSEVNPIGVLDGYGVRVLAATDSSFQNDVTVSRTASYAESRDSNKVTTAYTLNATGISGLGIQVKVLMQLLPAF